MEQFLNQKVIIREEIEGILTSIDKDGDMISIKTNDGDKMFSVRGIVLGTIKFADEELQAVAVPYFEGLADYLEEKQNAETEKELEKIEYNRICSIRRDIGDSNVAFKCTFCNGGASKDHIGFNGVCSKDVQQFNVCHREWCSSKSCRCRKLLDGEMSQDEFDKLKDTDNAIQFLCYESLMLKNWKCYAGIDKNGNPMALNKAQTGSLAVLTTRPITNGQEAEQEDTQIFAVFLITRYSDNSQIGGFVGAHPEFRIELTPEESKQMLFWNYHYNVENPTKAFWGTGLHRYLSDMECAQILNDMVRIIKDDDRKELCQKLLDKFLNDTGIKEIEPLRGALRLIF